MRACVRDSECVCVSCVSARESVCVCVCERERESARVCESVHVCVRVSLSQSH